MAILLCFASPGYSGADDEIITELKVEGNRRVGSDAILANIKSRVGGYFSRETVSEDIKRIYKMGYFQDVKADYSTGDLGPILKFIVKERPFIRDIKIEGNDDLGTDKINEVLTVRKNTLFGIERVRESQDKIKEVYAERGFFLADVTYRLDEYGDEAVLVFEIKEGRKVKIRKINILGNKFFSDKKIKKLMSTNEGGTFSWLTGSGKFEEDTLQKDIDLIRFFYYNNGFIQLKITDPQVFMSPDKRWLNIAIHIDEGEQFRVGEISFEGDLASASFDIKDPEEIRKMLKTKEGDVFSRGNLSSDVIVLTDMFGDRGYAYADVSPRTDIDAEKKLVNISFNARKGQLVYIEKIRIKGNTKTRDKVVRREMRVSEGDLYNGSAIRRSRQRIFNLGFFKEANLTTSPGSDAGKINIDIDVEEGPTGTLSVGMGYSSIDGLVGMMQVSQGNLFGRGQKLSLNAEVGGESSNYSISFTEPYLFDTSLSAGFDIFDSEREYTDYSSSKKGWGLRSGISLGEYSRFNLGYRFEEINITNVDPDAPSLIQLSEGMRTTSSLTATISRDTRDNYMNPSRGSLNSLSAEYAGGILGQDNNFYKFTANSSWYFPALWDNVFMIHGRIGYAAAFEDDSLKDMVDERFFLGGINTLRGYDYRSVGPEEIGADGNPFVVGGDKELLFNVEYIFPISREAGLKGLVFFDAGNAFEESENYDLGNLRKSVGYGFRWYSPVGPLRLEWGRALDPQPGESKSRWEFSIGTFF